MLPPALKQSKAALAVQALIYEQKGFKVIVFVILCAKIIYMY